MRKPPKTKEQKAEGAKDARLRRFFRMSLKEYKQVEDFQATGVYTNCDGATIQQSQTFGLLLGTTRRALDHNHTTGQLRGILDWRVNRALGWLETIYHEKTVDALYALAAYMQFPPVTQVLGERYGIIGRAKKKKHPIYGSPNGPIKPEKKARNVKH